MAPSPKQIHASLLLFVLPLIVPVPCLGFALILGGTEEGTGTPQPCQPKKPSHREYLIWI